MTTSRLGISSTFTKIWLAAKQPCHTFMHKLLLITIYGTYRRARADRAVPVWSLVRLRSSEMNRPKWSIPLWWLVVLCISFAPTGLSWLPRRPSRYCDHCWFPCFTAYVRSFIHPIDDAQMIFIDIFTQSFFFFFFFFILHVCRDWLTVVRSCVSIDVSIRHP